MPKCHQIIRDESALLYFIDWLPELESNEQFFLCLQARKKYMPSLKSSDKTQLKRFVANKGNLLDKIKQLECPVGCYTTREGKVIEDQGIALYITLNPRNMRKAVFSSIQQLIGLIQKQDAQGSQLDLNPHSEVLNCIHKAKARSVFVHFDIDMPNEDESDNNARKSALTSAQVYKKTVEIVGEEAVTVIETRGGSHVVVNPKKVICEYKNWHPVIVRELQTDQAGDLMVPVVGCNQGGFVPRFYIP